MKYACWLPLRAAAAAAAFRRPTSATRKTLIVFSIPTRTAGAAAAARAATPAVRAPTPAWSPILRVAARSAAVVGLDAASRAAPAQTTAQREPDGSLSLFGHAARNLGARRDDSDTIRRCRSAASRTFCWMKVRRLAR